MILSHKRHRCCCLRSLWILAERGEIDPWDVKLIEVIDRFLSKLQPERSTETGRAPYEADLSQSGQAFLYASMLLLLKADSLARQEAEREIELIEEEEFLQADGLANAPLPPNLERRIRRRAVAPPASNRRVTLQELIAQLNLISAAMADQRPRRVALRRPRPQSQRQAIRAIAQLAHQENLSEVAAALEQFLDTYWETSDSDANWLDFESLLQMWAEIQVQPETKQAEKRSSALEGAASDGTAEASTVPTVHDRVGVFWALLFLSAQSKVELLQEEFYQDLKVRSLSEVASPALLEGNDVALLD
jgi:segregation and condensation protein A